MASNDEQRSATTIFTTAAQSIAARLIANKTTAKFTKAEISTTNLFNQSVTELQVLTSLDNVQQTADINTVTVINDNTVDVNVAIDQTKAPNDYQMNSVGLFAVDGDGKEVLYSVTVLKDPVYIHQDAMGSALGIDLETVVGQSKNVDLSINPAGAVTNEALKVTLADYAKKDEVQNLIPDDIATTKDLADGDAETLTSAKDYADTQASDKVKNADTANWQKAKISADDGSPKSFLYAKDNGNITMWIAGRPLGMHTFWCAAGVTGNPVSSSIQGTMSISSVKNGVGYCVSADGDFISITLVDGQVNYDILTKKSDIDPSVMAKTTLTATDDVLTLGAGTYWVWGTAPKNYPTSVPWGTVVVKLNPISTTGMNKLVEVTDTSRNRVLNTYSGSPATWSGWHIPNEGSLAIGAGANKIAANGNTFVPLAINVATGEICLPDGTAITLSLPGGVKLGDHMLNISATDGLTIDNQAYFTAVADEATAASKAAADPLHNYTTEE
ncbi:hypothetical protein EFS21_08040 [Levilactobacillus brevis]|uniref:hypothetical protein n=1 Tax=Levilactobacillus brevis TaxID=1580 RepID=UPI0005A89580|nr:hypothetical protein [Levilactobacillus brevis]KWT46768.1 hypothetical protein ABB39_10185 [Levilactobacillus brevis]KWU39454.1 hypothetical protein AV935_11065 [Levilactobacillus brevis]MCT3581966.1 hypothetical protein [Levilactobacillus brevis]MCT3590547.1 hypothetical protein [Levilactobacillus brevis]MDM7550917.1 hypothetical protein [Levilactobacillus brevis]